MDFQTLVSDYFNQRTENDPTQSMSSDVLELLDMSRNEDLNTRGDEISPLEAEEITEVDEQTDDPSSLTMKSEPATDSAIFESQEELGSDLPDAPEFTDQPVSPQVDTDSPGEGTEFTANSSPDEQDVVPDATAEPQSASTDVLDVDVQNLMPQEDSIDAPEESTDFEPASDDLSIDDSQDESQDPIPEAVPSDIGSSSDQEDAVVSELTRPGEEINLDPTEIPAETVVDPSENQVQFRNETELSHEPEDFPLDFNEAVRHIEASVLTGDEMKVDVFSQEIEPVELPMIPRSVYSQEDDIYRVSQSLMDRERQ